MQAFTGAVGGRQTLGPLAVGAEEALGLPSLRVWPKSRDARYRSGRGNHFAVRTGQGGRIPGLTKEDRLSLRYPKWDVCGIAWGFIVPLGSSFRRGGFCAGARAGVRPLRLARRCMLAVCSGRHARGRTAGVIRGPSIDASTSSQRSRKFQGARGPPGQKGSLVPGGLSWMEVSTLW